jgi:flagellar protein FliS
VHDHTSRYLESQVLTASRDQLLLLTYDGVLRFLARARRGIQQRDYHEKHIGLARARTLILELHRTLDFSPAPDLAGSLASLYSYLLDQLARADADDDESRVAHVIALVSDLRSTWLQAARAARAAETGVIQAEGSPAEAPS